MTRPALLLAALAVLSSGSATGATGDDYPDEEHPRSPGTPLTIELRPYYCDTCIDEERLEVPRREIDMMRQPVAELARVVGLSKNWKCLETPHFKILSTLKKSSLKFKDGHFVRADVERLRTIFPDLKFSGEGVRLTEHQRLHLYGIRAERMYAHLAALAGNQEPFLGMPSHYQVYVFTSYAEHHSFVDRYIGSKFDKGGVQWHFREEPRIMSLNVCADIAEARFGKSDQVLASHFMHNLAHNLIDGLDGYYRETWAWLEEGLGHYYERRETPRFNNFCWAEGAPPTELYKPKWETTVLANLRRGKDAPFVQWCEKLKPGELTSIEHGLCWSMVRWLIETEPLRLARLFKQIDDQENQPSCAEAIEKTFGVSATVLSQRWRTYVLEEYPKKK